MMCPLPSLMKAPFFVLIAVSIIICFHSPVNAYWFDPLNRAPVPFNDISFPLPYAAPAVASFDSRSELRASLPLASNYANDSIPVFTHQLSSADPTVSVYTTSDCLSGQVSSQSVTAGTCTSATFLTNYAGPQGMAFLQVFCSSGIPYLFGYSDSACTKVVAGIKASSSTQCFQNIQLSCPAGSSDTPNLPTFPPAGHIVSIGCSGNDCSTNCATSTYPPNVCRTVRQASDGSIKSMKSVCSNSDNRFSFQTFSDSTCTVLESAGVTTTNKCFLYEPSAQVSCPSGVATAQLPSFPPPKSMVGSVNCTDSGCTQGCTMVADVAGSCTSFPTKPYGNSYPSFARYCYNGHRAGVVYTDSSCSNPAFGVVTSSGSASCQLDGSTYYQGTCSSNSADVQVPSVLSIAIDAYSSSTCFSTKSTLLARSQTCIPSTSSSLKVDCSTPLTPIVYLYRSSTNCAGTPGQYSELNGVCDQGAVVNCPLSSSATANRISFSSVVLSALLAALVLLMA